MQTRRFHAIAALAAKFRTTGGLAAVLGVLFLSTGGCGYFLELRGEPLTVQSQAPAFSLPDPSGQQVSLQALLQQGPVVLVFYRGHW